VQPSVLDALRPRCLFCRAPVALRSAWRTDQGHVMEGVICCPACSATWPIFDGLPVLIPDVRAWTQQYAGMLLRRGDLTPQSEAWIGDALGPGSAFDIERQYLSNYASDHWSDLLNPGSSPQILDILAMVRGDLDGPALDLGCSAGRTAFALADRTGPVVGMDLHPGMIRLPARILHTGRAAWPLRRTGTAYDPVDLPWPGPRPAHLDFWIGDATQPPFGDAAFGTVLSFNLLDCLPSPADHIRELARLCRPGGRVVVLTPYDWSTPATAQENWIGGSGSVREDPAERVRELLAESFVVEQDERSVPWAVRLHDRCRVQYQAHLLVGRRQG